MDKEVNKKMRTQNSRPYVVTAASCLLACITLALTACGPDNIGGGPMDGIVQDYKTKQPVEGAIVVVKWWGRSNSFGSMGGGFCYYASSAVTDTQGRFHISRWTQTLKERGSKAGIIPEGQSVKAYKRGMYYADVPTTPAPMLPNDRDNYKEIYNTTIYVERDASPPAERITRLHSSYFMPCTGGGASKVSQRILYQAMADEGATLAVTRDQLEQVDIWLRHAMGNPGVLEWRN